MLSQLYSLPDGQIFLKQGLSIKYMHGIKYSVCFKRFLLFVLYTKQNYAHAVRTTV